MALYKVIDRKAKKGTPCRLVKANSAASALRHVAGTQFDVEVVMNAVAACDILTSGVAMEVAGEEAAPAEAPVVEGEEQAPAVDADEKVAAE